MATIAFTRNIQRHVFCPSGEATGETVRQVLDAYFAAHPAARGYVLDDQGTLRTHMIIFVNGEAIRDRQKLSDRIGPDDELYVSQALSGG